MNQFLDQLSSSFLITREYLKAGVVVSLLSVWVLVALFYYLNRYTRRRYFTIWTVAWLFYALWITLSFGAATGASRPVMAMVQQWCICVSAVFLLWGSLNFLGERVKQGLLAWFIFFLLVWSYIGAFHFSRTEMEVPAFSLIAISSVITASGFIRYRRRNRYIGATLLGLGFLLWGVYMAAYPFLENSQDLTSVALFVSAGLQLMLAVSMIILVLEEVRTTQVQALEQMQSRTAERDALQTRVQSTEERYRKLFDLASEPIVIAHADDLHILELNLAAERLLGISRSEATRHFLTNFCQVKLPDGSAPASSQEWFEMLNQQRRIQLTRKNGALAPVEVKGALVQFEAAAAYQFFILELTERAQLEQQLRHAEKLSAVGRMISGVAHELNNPLSVVKGYLELVLSLHELSPQTRADLEKAAHESNRAAKLVMNFLAFAREQPTQRQSVNVNELVRRMVELRRFDLMVAKTEVELDLDEKLPPIWAEPDQISQLVVNLMTNSMQAMLDLDRTGRMKIKTRQTGDLVNLSVEDNGPGVPAHLVERIFEPFFTTKEVGAGTGLGLSIAHSIMAEHKGRIFYQTAALGGAGFVLEFPAAPRDAVAVVVPQESAPALKRPTGSQPANLGKILVLDDEKSIAEMLGEMLDILGYTPTVCNAAAQALEIIEHQDFDLIISDFRMPGINGRQFYEMATKCKPDLAPKVVFITGDVVNDETREYLESIGNRHIAKPFTLTNVRSVIDEVMNSNVPAAAS